MENQNINPQDVKKDIENLVKKIKSNDASPKERLEALKLLNSLLEFNTQFTKELKNELDKQVLESEIN